MRLTVEKQFRGELGNEVEISSTSYFKEGESYFLYAFRGNDGKLRKVGDGMCGTPPNLLKEAKSDIEYAEDIDSGKIGTRIYGTVSQDKQETVKTPLQNVPLAGIEVTIRNESETFTTRTDRSGKFAFKNVPKGSYNISAAVTDGLRERIFPGGWIERKKHKVFVGDTVLLRDMLIVLPTSKNEPQLTPKLTFQRADSYNFLFTSLGSIQGRLLTSDGKVASKQEVSLFPIDENGKMDLSWPLQRTFNKGQNGEFVFESVPKGKYRIAVNPLNCHGYQEPQNARSFYPGVSNEIASGIVTVQESSAVSLSDFKLPRRLKERKIAGIVLAPDQKPVAGATVMLTSTDSKNQTYCSQKNDVIKTDEKGRFRIKGYESYEYQITAYRMSNGSRQFSKRTLIPVKGRVDELKIVVDSQY
ncbi:MAG: carboxypeptidase-like regulatory domain-containing protein [Pyrinomonadaceae bacterium]